MSRHQPHDIAVAEGADAAHGRTTVTSTVSTATYGSDQALSSHAGAEVIPTVPQFDLEPKEGYVRSGTGIESGVPDGGLRAWLVVFGGFLDFVAAFGVMNSFGTFQAYYEQRWVGENTSDINWIGSVQTFLLFLGGVVAGPAFDKWGARPLMLIGTALCTLSFLCTSFAKTFPEYLLLQGFMFGVGNGLLFYPATSAISEWFDEKRGVALGIAVAGSSAGGVLWPIVINKLLVAVGEANTQRFIAVITFPLLLAASILVVERPGAARLDAHGRPRRRTQETTWVLLVEWRFLVLSWSLLCIYCGMLVPFFYFVSYAEDMGFGSYTANNLLAVCYGGSVVGRIGAGWFADILGRFNTLLLITISTCMVTFGWPILFNLKPLMVVSFLYGLFSGGLIPLGSACIAQTCPDMGHFGTRIGGMMAICSVGALIGGPISGILKDMGSENSWIAVYAFAAGMLLLGANILFAIRFAFERRWNVVF